MFKTLGTCIYSLWRIKEETNRCIAIGAVKTFGSIGWENRLIDQKGSLKIKHSQSIDSPSNHRLIAQPFSSTSIRLTNQKLNLHNLRSFVRPF